VDAYAKMKAKEAMNKMPDKLQPWFTTVAWSIDFSKS
jgi:hypothetical protein